MRTKKQKHTYLYSHEKSKVNTRAIVWLLSIFFIIVVAVIFLLIYS